MATSGIAARVNRARNLAFVIDADQAFGATAAAAGSQSAARIKRARGADAILAGVAHGASIAVITRRSIRGSGVRAEPGGGIARPRNMTLVTGRANHGIAADTDAVLAGIGLGAGVAVVAGRAIRGRGIRTCPGGGIAGSRNMALVERGTDDRSASGTGARLAGIANRAKIAIVACRPVRLGRVRAEAGGRVAGPGNMTLVAGHANHRIGTGANTTLAGIYLSAKVAIIARSFIGNRNTRADPTADLACPNNCKRTDSSFALVLTVAVLIPAAAVPDDEVTVAVVGREQARIGHIDFDPRVGIAAGGMADRRLFLSGGQSARSFQAAERGRAAKESPQYVAPTRPGCQFSG